MITLNTEDKFAVLKTGEQFVIVIHDRIHGPFFNHQVNHILKLFETGGKNNE